MEPFLELCQAYKENHFEMRQHDLMVKKSPTISEPQFVKFKLNKERLEREFVSLYDKIMAYMNSPIKPPDYADGIAVLKTFIVEK